MDYFGIINHLKPTMMKTLLTTITVAVTIALVSFTTIEDQKIILIDPGHGGIDKGGMSNGVTEKEVVQQITHYMKEYSSGENYKLVFTREEDEMMSLSDRIAKANALKPDLVVSLHVNLGSDEQHKGIEAYVSKDNPYYTQSKIMGTKMLKDLTGIGFRNNGLKDAGFMIIKKVNAPAVLLELGYLNNEHDRSRITQPEIQQKMATSILASLR